MNVSPCACRLSSDRAVPLFLAVLVLLSSGGLLQLDGFFHDDAAWLISSYNSGSLAGFLDTGFNQLRRPLMGTFLYFFLSLHKMLSPGIAHAVWDLTIMGATFGAALVLFHLARGVLGGGTFAPAVAAALLAVHPIDTTLPIYIQVVYHIGVLLALLSLLLTHKAVVQHNRLKLFGAVVLSTIASYVFIEGVVTYEAARLVIIGIALRERSVREGLWQRLRGAIFLTSPFIASALALAVLKIKYPPFGMYAGAYAMNAANLLRPDNIVAMMEAALLSIWIHVLPFGLRYGLFPLGLGLAGAALAAALLLRGRQPEGEDKAYVEGGSSRARWMALAGLLLFMTPALLYLLVGKVPTPGVESRHGTVLEPGWALLVGGLVAMAMAGGRRFSRGVALASALVVGLGVYASNVSIAIYQETFDREILFWEKFVARFPTLPEHAPVMFDLELGGPDIPSYRTISTYYYYQIEFPLNLLYATSRTPGGFRVQSALESAFPFSAISPTDNNVIIETYWGINQLLMGKAIFVHYRDGELLVNEEISDRYIGLPYQAFLDRPAPTLPPPPPGGYPYRDRVTRYFSGRGGS